MAERSERAKPDVDLTKRRALAVAMRTDGHSLRAISVALGVSKTQVEWDLSGTPPTRVRGRDGKSYSNSRLRRLQVGEREPVPPTGLPPMGQRMNLGGEATVVYCIYTAENGLLYVGRSTNLVSRLAVHCQRSLWWASAAYVEWNEYEDATTAAAVEGQLIADHQPPYNVMGRLGDGSLTE